jgi:hypothetical protein
VTERIYAGHRQMFERMPAPIGFADYCAALRLWLDSAPQPDASLRAVADVLERHGALSVTELERLVVDAVDVHAALGAGVLLNLHQLCDQ